MSLIDEIYGKIREKFYQPDCPNKILISKTKMNELIEEMRPRLTYWADGESGTSERDIISSISGEMGKRFDKEYFEMVERSRAIGFKGCLLFGLPIEIVDDREVLHVV